ncbi:MAG: prepilin-type N-terminal cleavage/methylation domain-containing protein [Verrucomicrobiota bacterium JB022]|nr:prepilin-type N-terminal cleavage/methylation domain-containing protein [Verrucomicrobiota bacterium JB022]
MRHRFVLSPSRQAFTLLEVLISMAILSMLLGAIGVFMIEVSRSYYGAAAKTAYASEVRDLADHIGRDVLSSFTTTVYRSTTAEDWDDPKNDQLGANEAGRLLFLVQATVNYDSLPAYERIDRLIAYSVDSSKPVRNQDGETIGYPLFRYELVPPAGEDWVLQVGVYQNGEYDPNPGEAINHPATIDAYSDYIALTLQQQPEYMLTVSSENGTFNHNRAFIKLPNDGVALALGVVASSGNITDSNGDGIYEASNASIVTANTLNLSFAPRGYE